MGCSRLGFLSIALFTAGAGCTLLTDLGGLSEEGADAEAPSSTPDATAPGADGSAPSDGGDAGAEAGTRFCRAGTHAFCADFDGDDPWEGWDLHAADAPGELTASTARQVSGATSLRAFFPRRAALGEAPEALAVENFTGGWRRIVTDLEMYLEAPDWQQTDSNSSLLSVRCESSGANASLYMSVGRTSTQIGRSPNNFGGPVFPTDKWVHVHLDYDATSGGVSLKVGVDTWGGTLPAVTPGANARCKFSVGIVSFNEPIARMAVHYDDIVVDLP